MWYILIKITLINVGSNVTTHHLSVLAMIHKASDTGSSTTECWKTKPQSTSEFRTLVVVVIFSQCTCMSIYLYMMVCCILVDSNPHFVVFFQHLNLHCRIDFLKVAHDCSSRFYPRCMIALRAL